MKEQSHSNNLWYIRFISVSTVIVLVLAMWSVYTYVVYREPRNPISFVSEAETEKEIELTPEQILVLEQVDTLEMYGKVFSPETVDEVMADLVIEADTLIIQLSDISGLIPDAYVLNSEVFQGYGELDNLSKLQVYPDIYKTWLQMKKDVGDASGTDFEKGVQQIRFKTVEPQAINTIASSVELEDTLVNVADQQPIFDEFRVDQYIQQKAEARGYERRPLANASVLKPFDDYLLHPTVIRDWQKLVVDSQSYALDLRVVSGYRSPETQKEIFTSRLQNEVGGAFSSEQILSGSLDSEIDQVLSLSSIPGYSKHHTGYTIDINDLSTNQGLTQFKNTKGYQWLIADNYLKLKIFGFVPSYPVGGSNFGPNPEEWEYSWVGTSVLEEDYSLELSADSI